VTRESAKEYVLYYEEDVLGPSPVGRTIRHKCADLHTLKSTIVTGRGSNGEVSHSSELYAIGLGCQRVVSDYDDFQVVQDMICV
jgi:hypothetical protein